MLGFMNPWVLTVLLILSTHRITRLITRDVFPPARFARELIEQRLGEEHWLAYLTQCDWCASIYVSTFITSFYALYVANGMHTSFWPWPTWVLMGLTASTVTGLIASREPE